MEQHLTAGFQNPDALLSIVGKTLEVSTVPEERAHSRSPGHWGLLWGQGMLPGSWEISKPGQAAEGLQGAVPLSAHCGVRLASGKRAARGCWGGLQKRLECLSVYDCPCLSSSGTDGGNSEKEVAGCWTSHSESKSLCCLAASLSSAGQSWGKR